MAQNIYKVRSFPNGNDQLDTFKKLGIVALGWPKIDDISQDSRSVISKKLMSEYSDMKTNNRRLGLTTGFFMRLLAMRPGDFVLIPYENKIVWIAQVTGLYQFNKTLASIHCAHTVPVQFLKNVDISAIPKDLKKSLNGPSSVSRLTSPKYFQAIQALIHLKRLPLTNFNGLVYESNSAGKMLRLTVSVDVTDVELELFFKEIRSRRANP